MALDSYMLKFLKKELQNKDIETIWMQILKTYIFEYSKKNNKEDFSNHNDFKNFDMYESSGLLDMSLVDISLFYEYSLATADSDKRKQSGAYYTPQDIAAFMSEKSHNFEKNKIWLDPCSGIGNLSYHLASIQENPESFVENNLILQDIDQLALKIAHVIFALHFQNTTENYYSRISKNFVHKNFLEKYDKEISVKNSHVEYDYVIVNPPYISAKQDHRFITAESRDIYGYFLEKIILEAEGFISITPQSFINSRKFNKLRNLLIENMEELSIYAFDNIPDSIFKGYKYGSKNTNTSNSVRASIIIAKKRGVSKSTVHKVTPLLRWKTEDRETAISNFDNQLTTTIFKHDSIIPKIHKDLINYYESIIELPRLSSIISQRATDFFLIVPGTPRYFISACKTTLNRSSFHKIFFENEEAMNNAYLLLNSSLMYWWWRVNDGGMTLSKETLTSVPMIDFKIDSVNYKKLVSDLEASELVNKVNKVNSGKINENIKHPDNLIITLNNSLIKDKDITNSLYNTHKNSFLSSPHN